MAIPSFLTSLGILLLTAVLCALQALQRSHKKATTYVNILGALGASAGMLTGLFSLVAAPFNETLVFQAGFGLPFGQFSLVLDATARLFLLPVYILGLLCAVSGACSLRHEPPRRHNLGAHWLFYVLLLLGLCLVMTAADMILFMLAWELMSLAPFFLIDFNDGDSKVRDASWVYLTAAHLGAVFLMVFFVVLWQATGQTSLDSGIIRAALGSLDAADATDPAGSGLRSLLFCVMIIGFGAKAGLLPMHVWLPLAHPAAPSHVSALLSGAMINAGLYGVYRGSLLIAPDLPPVWWGYMLLGLGLATALMAILKATAQSNLKRLLAYSSVENMGLMFMGLGLGLVGQSLQNGFILVMGHTACLLHMLNHAAFKGLLFLGAGELLHRCGTVNMSHLGGLQKRLPVIGITFAIGCTSIACLPPCNGFVSEFCLALALIDGPALPAIEQQMPLLLAFAGLAAVSGLALALYAKAYGMIFLGRPRSGFAQHIHREEVTAVVPLILLAGACLILSLLAPQIFGTVSSVVRAVLPESCTQAVSGTIRLAESVGISGLTTTSILSVVLILSVGLLLLLRHMLLRHRSVSTMPTWGCGYQWEAEDGQGVSSRSSGISQDVRESLEARVQYTDAGFSEPLAGVLGSVMGEKVSFTQDSGIFPQESRLYITAPDRLRRHVFSPLFQAIESVCNMCKILQHGKIHLYILYILATLVVLLIWGV